MFPFETFPFPQVWLDSAPVLWKVAVAMEVMVAIVAVCLSLVFLIPPAITGNYDKDTARAGFMALLVALVLAALGPWFWVLAAFALVLYLLLYWVAWRLFVRNLVAVIFGDSDQPEE